MVVGNTQFYRHFRCPREERPVFDASPPILTPAAGLRDAISKAIR
jgi:hypothetical protein